MRIQLNYNTFNVPQNQAELEKIIKISFKSGSWFVNPLAPLFFFLLLKMNFKHFKKVEADWEKIKNQVENWKHLIFFFK